MKNNTVKINEPQLRKIVAESVKRVVNEISFKTLDKATKKSGGYDDYQWLSRKTGFGSKLHDAIDTVEENLEYYAWDLENGQAKKLLSYIDPIRDFFDRKGKQALNFDNTKEDAIHAAKREFDAKAKEMFGKSYNELTDEEYENVISNCSQETQECAEKYYIGLD